MQCSSSGSHRPHQGLRSQTCWLSWAGGSPGCQVTLYLQKAKGCGGEEAGGVVLAECLKTLLTAPRTSPEQVEHAGVGLKRGRVRGVATQLDAGRGVRDSPGKNVAVERKD